MTLPTVRWRDLIAAACDYAPPVPADVLEAMTLVESNGDPNAQSASDARGLTQQMPKWHTDLGLKVAADLGETLTEELWYEPKFNLFCGARHLAWCYSECGSWETAVAKYHSGKCDPPAGFVDGQGTSTIRHLEKFRTALEQVREDRNTEEDTTMARSRPYIIISAGHRSTQDPGNPTEKARTDDLARAYTDAFRKDGFRADWFQRDLDKDSNPDQTIGSLADVTVGVRKAVEAAPEELVIAMELHYDGGHSVVHTIVPDNVGLRSAMAGGDVASDTAANNTLDVALATKISTNIVYATGLGIYGGARLGKLGVMSERDTGVAQSGNWRLGFFGGTANQRMKAVRLIIEHAGWADPETLKPGFEGKCAQAVVEAVNAVLGLEPPVEKPEEPATPEPVLNYPPGMDRTIAIRLFDQATGDDGRIYGFDERGPVSQLWLSEGKRTGQYPALNAVWNYDDGDNHWRKYFVFSNGMVVLDTDTTGVVIVGDAYLVVDALRDVVA